MTQVFTVGVGLPKLSARQAVAAEEAGFDGLLFVDSQNLAGDPYVAMAMAAAATERLIVGTGVTNPFTRHPAVAATAAATVHAESGGRVLLGIGRGDSALSHLGLAPATVPAFERYLGQLQAYLRGEEVSFADAVGDQTDAPPVDTLGLAKAPEESRIRWLRGDLPKVPVTVAATGPRVIDVAARLADRVTFAVGADPERMAWAVEAARVAAGDRQLSLGAFVNVVVDDDRDRAREIGSGGMATFARFSVMHGTPTGPYSDDQRDVLRKVHGAYDMTRHTQQGTPQAGQITPEFADRFAILGPPHYCLDRLRALVDLGLDHFVVVGGTMGAAEASARFTAEVLPALKTL